MRISCGLAPSLDTVEHAVLAEELGYDRVWLYDSPAIYPDVWMTLALAAQRTSRIGLGPGVLIPSLRHPMVNASAAATLANLAPGRVAIAIGSGFTGRMVSGTRSARSPPGASRSFSCASFRKAARFFAVQPSRTSRPAG